MIPPQWPFNVAPIHSYNFWAIPEPSDSVFYDICSFGFSTMAMAHFAFIHSYNFCAIPKPPNCISKHIYIVSFSPHGPLPILRRYIFIISEPSQSLQIVFLYTYLFSFAVSTMGMSHFAPIHFYNFWAIPEPSDFFFF